MASISLEKRLRRLPLGVHSKKDIGERSTLISRSACRWEEAMMPQTEMATVVPKMAMPEGRGERVQITSEANINKPGSTLHRVELWRYLKLWN